MRKILWLARREYRVSVRTKGFIIGLIIAPLLMGGGAIAMVLLKDRVDTTDKHIAVVDQSGMVADFLLEAAAERNEKYIFDESGKKVRPAYIIEVVEPDYADPNGQRLMLSDKVRSGKLQGFLEIGRDVLHPEGEAESYRMTYHAKNAAMDNARGWLESPINRYLRSMRLTEAGIPDSAVNSMMMWIRVESMGLVSVDAQTGELQKARRSSEVEAFLIPFIMMGLLWMMMMIAVMPLMNAVMEEKTQRISEVLLGSVKPFEFMAGKLLGSIAVSLTAALVYVVGGIIAVKNLGLAQYIPYDILPWFFAYMLLAILMYGAIFTALGSACNNAKDAQSLVIPAIIPIMISWFVIGPIIKEPTAGFAAVLSLIPPCTPMIMLIRMSTPIGVPGWQPWAGLIGVLIFTFIAIWAGGRIFRVGILTQGGAPKFSKLMRWAIRG
jgi:ABC-2 type transport system permease protein